MSAVARIQSVLDSGLLAPQLMAVPATGATADEIQEEQRLLGRPLCPDHVEILRRWNGIVVGSDPSGFVYLQAADRKMYSFDTDGGDFEQIAENLDDFFERLVFGPDAATFAGEGWLAELREAGMGGW